MGSGGTSKWAPLYRCYASDGTSLYSGNLVLGDGTGASGTWGVNITGRANSVKDRTNDNTTYLNYGASGLAGSAISWMCCWNGYEIRAISKAETFNLVRDNGGDTRWVLKNSTWTEDFNTLTTSGFYRVNNVGANRPADWGQMIVCHGNSDTIFQLYHHYANNNLFVRGGNPSNVGGSGSWQYGMTMQSIVKLLKMFRWVKLLLKMVMVNNILLNID